MESEFKLPNPVSNTPNTPISPQTSKEPGPINIIPRDMIIQALSYLNKTELESASKFNKQFLKATIQMVHQPEYESISNFVNTLSNHLDDKKYAKQKEALKSAIEGTQVLGSVSLNHAKKNMSSLEENILNILKEFDKADLRDLKGKVKVESNSKFLMNVFDAAKVYKKLDREIKIHNELREDEDHPSNPHYELSVVIGNLCRCGRTDKALEVVDTIYEDARLKSEQLLKIVQILVKVDVEKAVKVAEIIPAQRSKNKALSLICFQLFENKTPDIIAKIANKITDVSSQSLILSNLSAHFFGSGNISKSLEVAYSIKDIQFDTAKPETLKGFSEALFMMGNHDKAREVAKKIPDNNLLDFVNPEHEQVLSLHSREYNYPPHEVAKIIGEEVRVCSEGFDLLVQNQSSLSDKDFQESFKLIVSQNLVDSVIKWDKKSSHFASTCPSFGQLVGKMLICEGDKAKFVTGEAEKIVRRLPKDLRHEMADYLTHEGHTKEAAALVGI